MIPAIIIYRKIHPPFGGKAYGPIVIIDPKYRNDEGLLQHELVHVKQFYRTFGLHLLLYHFKSYRLKAEIEAYKVQLKYSPQIDYFAEFLSSRYGLGINKDEARQFLRE